ncbi:CPBP family intramembrane glutamic endopeptidase [Paenibacillus sp. GCM10027627]|uniref:CPBP family intramembrane glutamic endopeptidase n=1 Tax=unclassified Paenibacillus TaxID=185978 RepID=UPI0036362D94
MMAIIYLILKDEITYDQVLLRKPDLKTAYKVFCFSLITQTATNFLLIWVFGKQETRFDLEILLPIIPVYAVLLAPIIEEIIFRHIIFGWIQGSKEKFSIIGAFISSTLFGIMHMNVILFIGYFAVGYILCYFYFKTKNVLVIILAHIMLNFFALMSQSIHIVFGGV